MKQKTANDYDVLEMRNQETLSRRTFLKNSGLSAIGITILATANLAAISAECYAPDAGTTLLKMARDIFPHDRIPDEHYMSVLAPYVAEAVGNKKLKLLVANGVTNLNEAAMKQFGKNYAEVPTEGDRVSLLYGIEQTEFFQKVRSDLKSQLYNNKAVWPLFGYQGSSWEKGGYINQGFDDIDWLGSL